MGWCYTFGVRCGTDCNHPMLVREKTRACACEACGATCYGMFSNCHEIVFRPGGLDFQLRCIPQEVSEALERSEARSEAEDERAITSSQSAVVTTGAPVGPPPHRRSEEMSGLAVRELQAGFSRLLESVAAINLSLARLESEVASLRREMIPIKEMLSGDREKPPARPTLAS